jgi:hypothetical protein
MYCIVEKNDSNNKVISIINSADEFITIISELNENYQIKDIINFESKTTLIETGFYLVKNNRKIELIEVSEEILKGYLYNSTKYNNKIIREWELLDYEIKNNNELESIDNLKKFNMTSVKSNSFVIMFGNSDLDRTRTVYDIMDSFLETYDDDLDNIDLMVISFSDKMIPKYKIKYPTATVLYYYDELKPDFLNKSTKQKCLIIDNSMSVKNNINITFEKLFVKCKTNNILTIITSKYPNIVNEEDKKLFDHVILLEQYFDKPKLKLYECYGDVFPTFNIFDEYLSSVTKNCGGLVINKNQNNNVYDQIFKY